MFRLTIVVFFILGSGCGSALPRVPAPLVTEPSSYEGAFSEFAVACDHTAGSEAGAEVLRAGGNAADAAAAAMLALGVVNPASSGLGGGAFILYYRASDGSLTFLDARERAPAAADSEMFSRREAELRAEGEDFSSRLSLPSQLGGLATGVPGEAAGIDALLTRFGRASRATVFDPAIRLAQEGIEVSEKLAHASENSIDRLRRDPVMNGWLRDGSSSLEVGQRLVRPRLADTLRAFAREGASELYRGSVASEIVSANREQGGIMTADDLADYEVRVREPLDGEFFGLRWVTAPPPSAGGFTMFQSLALLDGWIGAGERSNSVLWFHALAESWKGPYLDRARYFGDPDHVELPLDALMSPGRLSLRSALFDRERETPAERFSFPLPDTVEVHQPEGGGTSHLCVVDAEGNVAAVTTTINLAFGAGYTAAGIVMNDEMDDFARGVGLENAYGLPGAATNLPGPGRRPVSTMSPTIILNQRGPVLCLGASGGSRIVTAIQQVALNHLVLGLPLADAVTAPRIHHQGAPDVLRSEESYPLDEATLAALVRLGHEHQMIANVAVVQAIGIERGGSFRLIAVSDPRKGGRPRGR